MLKPFKVRGTAELMILLCGLATTSASFYNTHSHLVHCYYKNMNHCSFKAIESAAMTLFVKQKALTS